MIMHRILGAFMTSELHPEIQELCLQGKVTRVDSFSTMRALSHALQAIGKPLHIFQKDPQLHLGPYELCRDTSPCQCVRSGASELALHGSVPVQASHGHLAQMGCLPSKGALKQSQGQLLKVLLSFSLFYNLNYGPSNSRAWFAKKQAQAKEFVAKHSGGSLFWTTFLMFVRSCRFQNLKVLLRERGFLLALGN